MKITVLTALIVLIAVSQAAPALARDLIRPEPLKLEDEEMPRDLNFQTYHIFQLETEVVWYGKCKDWYQSLQGKATIGETEVVLEKGHAETQMIRVQRADFSFPTDFSINFSGKNYQVCLLPQKKPEVETIYFRPSFVRTTVFCDVSYPGSRTLSHKTEMSLNDLKKIATFKLGDLEFKARDLFPIDNNGKELYFQIMGESKPTTVFPRIVKGSVLETLDEGGKKIGEITLGNLDRFLVVTYEWYGVFWPEDKYGSNFLSWGWAGVIDGKNARFDIRKEHKIVVNAPFKPATEMFCVTDPGKVIKLKVTDQIPPGYAKIEKLVNIEDE